MGGLLIREECPLKDVTPQGAEYIAWEAEKHKRMNIQLGVFPRGRKFKTDLSNDVQTIFVGAIICHLSDNRGIITPTLNVIAEVISLIEARVSDLLWPWTMGTIHGVAKSVNTFER